MQFNNNKKLLLGYLLDQNDFCFLKYKKYYLKSENGIIASRTLFNKLKRDYFNRQYANKEKERRIKLQEDINQIHINLSRGFCLLKDQWMIIHIEKNKIDQIKKKFKAIYHECRQMKNEFIYLKNKMIRDINFYKNHFLREKNLLELKENQLFLIANEKNKKTFEAFFSEAKPSAVSQYESKYYDYKLKLYFLNNNKIINLEFDKIRISDHKAGVQFNNTQRFYKTINDKIKLGLPKRKLKNFTSFGGFEKGWSFEYLPLGIDIVINDNNQDNNEILLNNIEELTAGLCIN